MRILVTGGKGQLARALAQALSEALVIWMRLVFTVVVPLATSLKVT